MTKTAFLTIGLFLFSLASADEVATRRNDEAALQENPEEQRRTRNELKEDDTVATDQNPDESTSRLSVDPYVSLRAIVINAPNESGDRESRLSDGYSRAGMRLSWELTQDWEVYGRAEYGIDLVDNFATRGGFDETGGPVKRLVVVGIDHDRFAASFGKNWGVYYQIAGMTDRFAIYGGSATGAYNAGSDGSATGIGRADDAFQGRIYIRAPEWLGRVKPFNLNVQYQPGQAIPRAESVKYARGIAASAWLESEREFGLGLAYNKSEVRDASHPDLVAVGLDGDSTAFAASSRWFGEHWYISAVVTRLKNIETTNLGRYFDGRGVEIYGQFEFAEDWWLVGGGNWLRPDDDEIEAGQYEVDYYVLGGRYTFESFDRMIFFEYKHNNSRLVDGTEGDNELVIGVRWGWGY